MDFNSIKIALLRLFSRVNLPQKVTHNNKTVFFLRQTDKDTDSILIAIQVQSNYYHFIHFRTYTRGNWFVRTFMPKACKTCNELNLGVIQSLNISEHLIHLGSNFIAYNATHKIRRSFQHSETKIVASAINERKTGQMIGYVINDLEAVEVENTFYEFLKQL